MTRRIALKVNGRVYQPWTEVEIVRDLAEISGGFRLSYYDAKRTARALRPASNNSELLELRPGQECRLEIDGELVLLGHIDDVGLEWGPDHVSAAVTGRDRTGDLVDCAATVDGPAELMRVTLLEIAERICRPFGIAVRSEVGAGPRFERFSIDVAETAMSAIDKAARQAAVLVTSDGVGGLVLTRSGSRRAAEALRLGEGAAGAMVANARSHFSWRQRFSDYVYKAQHAGARTGGPPLSHTAVPLTALPTLPPQPAAQAPEARSVIRTGRARDPEVTRWRPRVRLVRTDAGTAGASPAEQADWLMRTARGQSEGLTYTVQDWRAGPDTDGRGGRLWRPNEVVAVVDPYAGIDRDMLISGVSYLYRPARHPHRDPRGGAGGVRPHPRGCPPPGGAP